MVSTGIIIIIHRFDQRVRTKYMIDSRLDTEALGTSSSSSLTFKVTKMQSARDNILFTVLRQCWTVPRCQMTFGFTAVLFISIDRMPETLDNADR